MKLIAMGLFPLLMATCGGGSPSGSIRTTTPERVVREGSECITQWTRYRVAGPCSSTAVLNRYVAVYDDDRAPYTRECLGDNTTYSGCI